MFIARAAPENSSLRRSEILTSEDTNVALLQSAEPSWVRRSINIPSLRTKSEIRGKDRSQEPGVRSQKQSRTKHQLKTQNCELKTVLRRADVFSSGAFPVNGTGPATGFSLPNGKVDHHNLQRDGEHSDKLAGVNPPKVFNHGTSRDLHRDEPNRHEHGRNGR